MPFLHLLSIDWSALTAVYAMWTMRKGTAALAEGVGMPFPESSLHSIRLFLTRMDVFVSGGSRLQTRQGGLSNCHLDPFGIVIPSTHFKSIIVNSPNHHAKECAND